MKNKIIGVVLDALHLGHAWRITDADTQRFVFSAVCARCGKTITRPWRCGSRIGGG